MITARRCGCRWLGLFATAVVAASVAASEPPAALTGLSLVQALKAGGYNIYFRHVATDWSQSDDVRRAGDWLSCDPARIRQLSAAGRETAKALGAAIRALGIPVGSVLASPYCRTVETARLMDLGEVQTTTDVMNLRVAEYFDGRAAIAQRARKRLAMAPAAGTNTIVVAHGNVAGLATGVHLGEGEGAVFRPLGATEFVHVGSLTPRQWTRAARELAAAPAAPP